MDLNKLKIKIEKLAEELGGSPENMGVVISGLNNDYIQNALNGSDEKTAVKIEEFFTSREYAFSIYTEEQQNIIRNFEKRILDMGGAGKALENSGISASAMSSLRRGTYKGVTENVFSKISSFLELKDENSKVYKHNGYVPTSISESIYENIRTAHISGVCVMVTGDAGIGKTEAAKHYQETHPESSVIITAGEPRTNKTAMFGILAEELGIDLSETKRGMYFQKIRSELHDGMVIIVDEAQNFTFDAIDTLRGFSDYFKNKNLGTVGIVCMGNDTFRQQFFGKSGIGKEQVWNRFVERPKYQVRDIRYSDIELLFPELARKGMKQELKFLYGIALSPKEDIRSAVHLYTKIYNVHNGNCTIEMLVKQAKRMQVDITNINAIMNRLNAIK